MMVRWHEFLDEVRKYSQFQISASQLIDWVSARLVDDTEDDTLCEAMDMLALIGEDFAESSTPKETIDRFVSDLLAGEVLTVMHRTTREPSPTVPSVRSSTSIDWLESSRDSDSELTVMTF